MVDYFAWIKSTRRIFIVAATSCFVQFKTASVSRYIWVWVWVVHDSGRVCPRSLREICISPEALLPKEFKISCISARGTDFTVFPRTVININTCQRIFTLETRIEEEKRKIVSQKWISIKLFLSIFLLWSSFASPFDSINFNSPSFDFWIFIPSNRKTLTF